MSEEPPPEILVSLPRTRPHRRSEKRPTNSGSAERTQPTSAKAAPAPVGRPKPASAKDAPGPDGRSKGASGAKASAKSAPGKRTGRPAPGRSQTLRQPKQPGGTPPRPAKRKAAPQATPSSPAPPAARRGDVVSTLVHAAAELTEIGLSVSARALRGALGRLPRP